MDFLVTCLIDTIGYTQSWGDAGFTNDFISFVRVTLVSIGSIC